MRSGGVVFELILWIYNPSVLLRKPPPLTQGRLLVAADKHTPMALFSVNYYHGAFWVVGGSRRFQISSVDSKIR